MIIPVYTDGQKLEYFTIELQGQLEPTHGEILDGLRIGALRVEQGIPYMIVGGHQLEGKLVELKKPLAVIQKLPSLAAVSSGAAASASQIPASAAIPSTAPSASQLDTQVEQTTNSNQIESPAAVYSVVGFVRRKVCFTKRPLPMVQGGMSSLSKRAARGDEFPQPVGILDA